MARKGSWAARSAGALTAVLIWAEVLALCAGAAGARGGKSIMLRESCRVGTTTRVQTELKAKGLYRPGLPPQDTSGKPTMPKPLSAEIETRFVFHERVLAIDRSEPGALARTSHVDGPGDNPQAGRPVRVVRHVIQAGLAVNGEVRQISTLIRPEVRLLVAERHDRDGTTVVVSPVGPLTWDELELVQGLGDPLELADLLPDKLVSVGDRWRVRDSAGKGLSEYDALTSSTLEASLESVDDTKARIRLKGKIQGSARGGAGKMTCEGFLTFDRQVARIDHLDLNRSESRQAGPIEAGLDYRSTLTVTRQAAEVPPTLSDAAMTGVSLSVTPASEMLRLNAPGGKAALLHNRQWHKFYEGDKTIVLKQLRGGQVIAQCNLMVGPEAGKGRHQDPNQFREDIRRGLKNRFVQFLGAGEIDGDPAGGFRYKVGIQGREGQLGIVWYYYLVASPEGEQLLATYTLAEDHVKVFGNQDLEMIGSLQWLKAPRVESRD
jgi:hypothetical protein